MYIHIVYIKTHPIVNIPYFFHIYILLLQTQNPETFITAASQFATHGKTPARGGKPLSTNPCY